MPQSFDEIRQSAQQLPEDQRLMLANALLESMSDWSESADAQLVAAWDEEIARRVAEIKSGTAKTCSLEELASDLSTIVDR
jgi:putative addiction module component (TIGR02574 family)